MNRTLHILLLLLVWLGGSACPATPPTVCPNLGCPSQGQGDALRSTPSFIELPQSGDIDPEETIRGSVVTSIAGVFDPNEPVTVGVALEDDFQGESPLVGPLDALETGADLGTEAEIQPQADGSVEFGVYVELETTPGLYTFFALQGAELLEVTIEIN